MNRLCTVCGGKDFVEHQVLWPELCEQWELNEREITYVNRQQGHCCVVCGSNMRSRVLALALITSYQKQGFFRDLTSDSNFGEQKIVEINQAGSLNHYLSECPRHRLIEYPQFDMMNLDLPSGEYDIVIHSDTLEHVPDPLQGMKECHRILRAGGKCFYTVPVIVDRMTKCRAGLPESYHGYPSQKAKDNLVHSEFGADVWKIPLQAGFNRVTIHTMDYPSAIAFEAVK